MFVIFSFTGCALNPVTRHYETRLISESTERKIGEETKKQLVEEYGALEGDIVKYVSGVGANVVKVCDRPKLEYTFTVLDTNMVNAFAAPGGFIFVTKGLLEELSDEAELACVLGHEIGHVAAYHPVKMIQKQMGYGVLSAIGAIAVATNLGPEAMEMIIRTANLFTELYLLGYSRDNELQADRLGLKYAFASGYDPEGAVTFFERLDRLEKSEEEDSGKWDQFFRSHPPTKERLKLARRYLNQIPENRISGDHLVSNTEQYQKTVSGLSKIDVNFVGRIEGKRYVNDALKISLTLPEGWRFNGLRLKGSLAVFSSDDKGVYGELRYQIIKSTTVTGSKGFAGEASRLMRLKEAIGKGKEISYQAGESYLGHYKAASSLGQDMEARALFVLHGKEGIVLICYAPPEEFTNHLLDFEMIMRSLQWG